MSTQEPPRPGNYVPVDPLSDEAVQILLELAMLELTPERGATFSFLALVRVARDIGGPEVQFRVRRARRIAGRAPETFERVGRAWRMTP